MSSDAPKRPRTLVQTATYNEMESLPRLVEGVFAHAPGVDLLVIDDNSPDGTGRWVDEQSKADPRIKAMHRKGKLGLGSAILAGLQYAVEHGYDHVVNMDADYSHDPKYLPAMLRRMESAPRPDVVIGSRYIAGGGIVGWPFKRHVMSRAINIYSRILLGLQPRDCSGGYRCYRVATIARMNLKDDIESMGYSFQEEVLWHIKRARGTFAEIPIVFVDREVGASKINSGEAYSALWIIIKLGWRNFVR